MKIIKILPKASTQGFDYGLKYQNTGSPDHSIRSTLTQFRLEKVRYKNKDMSLKFYNFRRDLGRFIRILPYNESVLRKFK